MAENFAKKVRFGKYSHSPILLKQGYMNGS